MPPRIANLELMPLRANESKNAKIGSRQMQKAEELYQAGLLSKKGVDTVRAAWDKQANGDGDRR